MSNITHRNLSGLSRTLRAFAGAVALCIGLLALPHAGRAQVSILEHHFNQFRTGANTNETVLTGSNIVNSGSFGKLYSYAVDGYVFAQPLYVPNLTIGGTTHNVLFVATMEDSVYAFDADTNVLYWHTVVTGSGETPVPIQNITGSDDENIHGDVGIESTPVIDSTTSTIYVVAASLNTSSSTYYHRLHALSLTSGTEKFGGPATISTSGFNTKMQNQRPGLVEANGDIYVAFGSYQDITPYNAYVMSYSASTLAQVNVVNLTSGGSQGAVWNSGQAPATDKSGDLYITTANGDDNFTNQWSETCLKLSSTFGVLDWQTPADYQSLNSGDEDYGCGGNLLIPSGTNVYPSTEYVITGGKDGRIFVLDKNTGMGHLSTGDTAVHQVFQAVHIGSCSGQSYEIHGTPVFWDSASNGETIYVWGDNDCGRAYKFNGSTFTTTASSTTTATSPTTGCGSPGAILAVSASGSTGGILWANCVYTGDADSDIVPGILRAYNANNLGTEYWDSNQDSSRDSYGNFAKYVPPVPVNGKVYMATWSDTVNVYAPLTDDAPPISDGTYRVVNLNSGLALTASGTSSESAVEQESYTGASTQKWVLDYLGGGQYSLTETASGLELDVEGGSSAPGAFFDIYPSGGSNLNREFVIKANGSGQYTVQAANSGLLMEVESSGTNAGQPIDQNDATGGANQQWTFSAP